MGVAFDGQNSVPVEFRHYDLYDFKYSNNVSKYKDSPQLHLYKYFWEKNNPGTLLQNLKRSRMNFRPSSLTCLKTPGKCAEFTCTPAPVVKKEIKVGSTVRLKKGAKTYTGGNLASFVYNRDHKVKQINVDRVVITFNNIVVAAVKKSDLTLVE